MNDSVNIHFLGAAGTVTGSKYLVELPGKTILIDCGMFQCVKKLRQLNWKQLPSAMILILQSYSEFFSKKLKIETT